MSAPSLAVGSADVLGVRNPEVGIMAAGVFSFVARAEAARLAPGTKAPVMLTSRADNDPARLVSRALTQLYEHWRREGRSFGGEPTIAKAAE